MKTTLPFTVIEGVKCFSPEMASRYDDYPDEGFDLTDELVEDSFWVGSRNRLFKRIVFDYMAPGRSTRFLEIGCGTGNFIEQIVDNKNLEITGSEIYLKGLIYAKKNLPCVDFVQFDVTQGGIGDEFDLIVAFDVIEHIEDDIAALTNMGHMLEVGGHLIITVPQHMLLWGRLDEIVKHKRRYSRRELVEKMRSTGFEVTFTTSFLFVLFPFMFISRLMDKKHDEAQPADQALKSRVTFNPVLNWIFDKLMRIDEWLIRMGVSLPFGGTLVAVAKKL